MLRSRTPKIQPIIAPAIESLEEEHNNQLLNLASEDDRQLSLGDDLIKILQIRRLVKSLEDKSIKEDITALLDQHSIRMTKEDLMD